MARDLDESGISPRRSVTREGTRVRRAELATRQPPPVVAGMDDVAPEPQMPPGTRAGQFPDDEGWSGAARTGAPRHETSGAILFGQTDIAHVISLL